MADGLGRELKGCPQPPPITGRKPRMKGARQKRARAVQFGPRRPRIGGDLDKIKGRRKLNAQFRHKGGASGRGRKGLSLGQPGRSGRSWALSWVLRKVRQMIKGSGGKGDFRNHGFTKSGKGGYTGRRGMKSRRGIF